MIKRIALSFFIASVIISCNLESRGVPCDCSSSVEINNKTIMSGDNLPDNLTCVVANSDTYAVIIEEILSSYNKLFQSQLKIEKEDESWEILEGEIEDWLGGVYVGDCGNLSSGLRIRGFDNFGEIIDIEIKANTVELISENGKQERAPYSYQADVIFSVRVSGGNERNLESNTAKSNFVLSTCNQYTEIK